MALCLVFIRQLFQFSHFFPGFPTFFDLSITEETWVVEMSIWCIIIINVLVLHYNKRYGLISVLKGHNHRFSRFFFKSLKWMINVFLIIRQNVHIIWPVKREIQGSNALSCKQQSTRLYRHMYSMWVRYSTKHAI
jgi:hypothetical protein